MGKLIGVLIASVVAALLITVFFATQYGPKEGYALNAVLIAPDVLNQFNYNDMNPKTGAMDRFVFDALAIKEGGIEKPLSQTAYENLYKMIESEWSVEPSEALFKSPSTINLIVYSRTESPAAWQAFRKEFQRAEFTPVEGYFRVELHEDNQGIHWVYFRQRGAYEFLSSELKL